MEVAITVIKMTAATLRLLYSLLAVSGIQLGARATTECTSGFISLDRLNLRAARISVLGRIQMVFPNINFTCNGTITDLTVLARRHEDRTLYPELQVWRSSGNGVYNRIGGITLREELSGSNWDIYKHKLNLPLNFQDKDTFGIFQPRGGDSRLRVVFQRNSGPESLSVNADSAPYTFSSTIDGIFYHYPLVTITADRQECVRGSASLERVETMRSNLNDGRHNLDNRQSVSPQIKFTCDGNITKWIVGANNWDSDNDLYPELQVWRRANESIPNSYHRVGSTAIAVAVENKDSHVYEYLVDPPLPVKAGDVLGIYQPLGSVSRLRVLYERDSGPETLYQTPRSEEDFPEPAGETVESHSSLPLVTVEIAPNPTSVVLSTKLAPPSTSPVVNISVISKSISPVSETPVSTLALTVTTMISSFSTSPVMDSPVISRSISPVSETPVPTSSLTMVFSTIVTPVFSASPFIDGTVVLRSTFSIAETPGSGVDMPASFPATAVGVGVAVGVVVAIATLAVVIVIVLVCNNKKRRYSLKQGSSPSVTGLSNPVYESTDGNGQPVASGHSVRQVNDYMLDETGLENGQQKLRADSDEHFLRNPIYGTAEFSDETRLEDSPRKLRADSTEHYLRNPIYETTQPDGAFDDDSNATQAVSGEYMYVPTLEQRQSIKVSSGLSDESLYTAIYSRVKKEHHQLSQQSQQFFKQEEIYWEPASDSDNLYSQLASHKYREIPRSQIRTTDNLGSGQFGTVDKGVWLAPCMGAH